MSSAARVYIIGFMGSGKSTAGRKLAAMLGWQFTDLDKEIELLEGKSIKEIFSVSGETYFRELESSVLRSINNVASTVISAGGGTPCQGSNMDFMLSTGLVVYLRMTPGQLESRLSRSATARPLINNIPEKELLKYISEKLSEREKYYTRASIIVEGIDLDVKALSQAIILRNSISPPFS
jgi:shikimate kinase